MFCRGLHAFISPASCFFTKGASVWLFSGEVLWLKVVLTHTLQRVLSSDGIYRSSLLLEKDSSLHSKRSLCIWLQNFEANLKKQNVNFPSNFSLHIFQHFFMMIQEKIHLTGCQGGIATKVDKWSWRSFLAREAAQAEELFLYKALVPKICECLVLQMGVTQEILNVSPSSFVDYHWFQWS